MFGKLILVVYPSTKPSQQSSCKKTIFYQIFKCNLEKKLLRNHKTNTSRITLLTTYSQILSKLYNWLYLLGLAPNLSLFLPLYTRFSHAAALWAILSCPIKIVTFWQRLWHTFKTVLNVVLNFCTIYEVILVIFMEFIMVASYQVFKRKTTECDEWIQISRSKTNKSQVKHQKRPINGPLRRVWTPK